VRDGRRRRPVSLRVTSEITDRREYAIPANARVRVESGEYVRAGHQLTEGSLDPQEVLDILGPEACQVYLVDEVQKVYRSQGVNINDRHIEVIVRQMMRKVRIEEPGDTDWLPSELSDRWDYEERNAKIVAEGGEPATAVPVLLGVTKASLSTDSFLAAASFQETTRVLTDAAIEGKTDYLRGLKENVIIGKLIPARARITVERPTPIAEIAMPESLLLPFVFDFERQEVLVGETPSVFQPSEEITAQLAGASYVAEPE
jgi:DNA-directed RNA polymerase subunit beta'